MDLQLQFEEVTCYETLGSLTATHEETLETAIPEYCPDVARIVDTVGQLCIKEKLPGNDRYIVSGTVKVTVLYTSEESGGVRSLRLSVPFSCQWDDARLSQCQLVSATGRVLLAEARVLTSRKLYLRVLPEVTITPYCQVKRALCTGIEEEQSLRVKRREYQIGCLCDTVEKQFTFAQDVVLPEGSRPEDLLLIQLCPRANSLQRIGNKFSLKGEVTMRALYRDEERSLQTYEAILPLAEILEGADMPEEAAYTVNCALTECDGRLLRAESGCGIGITAGITVEIFAYCQKTVSCVEDVYSLCYQTEIESETVNLPVDQPPRKATQDVAERFEFAYAEPFIFITQWDLSPVAVMQEDRETLLRTTLHLKALYLDENGAPMSAERTQEISIAAGEVTGNVFASCCGFTAQCSGSVCQVRGQVNFSVGCGKNQTVCVITAVSLTETQENCQCPSLVLRRLRNGETLWDIAKQYQTEQDAIMAANPAGIDGGNLLLIPKVR